jgi:hypothetical protein
VRIRGGWNWLKIVPRVSFGISGVETLSSAAIMLVSKTVSIEGRDFNFLII